MREEYIKVLVFSPILICFIPLGLRVIEASIQDKGAELFFLPLGLMTIVVGCLGLLSMIGVFLSFLCGC